ncbi:MAG: PaaI family thioesterase [Armatimonadota bacterium]
MSLPLEVDRFCFVCGPDNPDGLNARFQCEAGRATGTYAPRTHHQGYAGMAHGGILAALLDEAMVYAAITLGRWATTAELTVRYARPAGTDRPLVISAEVTRHARKLVECRAEIRDEEGALVASAQGKLLQGRELTERERTTER